VPSQLQQGESGIGKHRIATDGVTFHLASDSDVVEEQWDDYNWRYDFLLTQRRYESKQVFSLQYNVDFICVLFFL